MINRYFNHVISVKLENFSEEKASLLKKLGGKYNPAMKEWDFEEMTSLVQFLVTYPDEKKFFNDETSQDVNAACTVILEARGYTRDPKAGAYVWKDGQRHSRALILKNMTFE